MGRHQPAEPRRKCAKTETPLIKYSLERGALGSQREGAALGAGRGMRRGWKDSDYVGKNKFRIEERDFRRFPSALIIQAALPDCLSLKCGSLG